MEDHAEFLARAYQVELFELAMKQNAIIYLPTGAGKTFVAIMVLKALSADIRRSYDDGGKHSVFIVNTVELCKQQNEYINRLTGLSSIALSGDIGVDFWDNIKWNTVLRENQVMVMTAQILVNALSHSFVKLNRINFIIFDECHNAVNDHPMRQIMHQFQYWSKQEQPRILGLSASLLNGNVKLNKVESTIRSLEITFNAKVFTAEVQTNYYSSPKEVIVKYNNSPLGTIQEHISGIADNIMQLLQLIVLNDCLNHIESSPMFRPKTMTKNISNMLKNLCFQTEDAGIYGGYLTTLLYLVDFECLKKTRNDEDGIYVLEYVITEVTKCRKLLENEMKGHTGKRRIHSYSSDKVQKLLISIQNFYKNRLTEQKFCCLIFVRRRITAIVLYQILKNLAKHDEDYKFLIPDFVISHAFSMNLQSKTLYLRGNAKDSIHRFKSGLSNCIVCTDVIDEGIDIPFCTLVIRYDLAMDIRAYIQSKGRARHFSSEYIMLLPETDLNYLERYRNFKIIENHLQQLLKGKRNEDVPTIKQIETELYNNKIETYIVNDSKGRKHYITEQMAISVVNMYCMSMLKSRFVHLSPIWQLHKMTNGYHTFYKVSLQLPSVSPLKRVIFGDAMENISSAKRSAAMNMCIELHKMGELSDTLSPNTADSLQEKFSYLFPNWMDESNSKEIGTYKKKRHHKLQFPSALFAAIPLPQVAVYLHILHVESNYSGVHRNNQHLTLWNLLHNNAGFCILSTKQMPEVPSFPLFMSTGELRVSLKVNHSIVSLSEEEIMHIKVFHTLIFNEIVPIIKPFLVFDKCNLDNSFFVTPVNEYWNINWEVIKKYTHIERLLPPDPFHFKPSDYELALIIPNYRASASVYIVTEICDDITPNSCFPTDNFYSYAHYYKQKHGLMIKDLSQPLLEVKAISTNINYIMPRSTKHNLKKRQYVELQEHLVPELCTRINFPALYWLKAKLLPSILHRVSQLLIANDLRLLIASEAKLGALSNDHTWPPLVLTYAVVEEYIEPVLEIPSTESVYALEPELLLNRPEIDVLNTDSRHYPGSKNQELTDVYRDLEEIQLIQIEYYYQNMYEQPVDVKIIEEHKKICFASRQLIKAPEIKVLTLNNSDGPDPVQIMYALTKCGHDAFNLERLETSGDSYLKFIVTLFLYNEFPLHGEGTLTSLKGRLIGNRNLYYCGINKNIPGRMKVDDFVPLSNFIAPAYTVFRQLQDILLDAEVSPNVLYEIQIPQNEQFNGYISNSTHCIMTERVLNWETAESQTGMEHYLGIQTVSDKAVADCVEALIGVYLNTMGIEAALTLVKWFEILPNKLDIASLLRGTAVTPVANINVEYLMPWALELETRIGYKFKKRELLLSAFTHPSYTRNAFTESYERLEFIGDAVIDFLITCYIYEYCGNLDPGALTDLRSALVNNITFACLSVRYGLHTALLSYAPELDKLIARFVKFQEERDYAVNDELLWILLQEEECNMAEYVDVPKVLGDIFESLIGAIYFDSNKNLTIVWEVIYSFMHKEFDQFSKNIPKQPIRVLYEIPGAKPQFLKAVAIENTDTIMVALQVTVDGTIKVFHGFGGNKKQAKCAAAKQALKRFLCKT